MAELTNDEMGARGWVFISCERLRCNAAATTGYCPSSGHPIACCPHHTRCRIGHVRWKSKMAELLSRPARVAVRCVRPRFTGYDKLPWEEAEEFSG